MSSQIVNVPTPKPTDDEDKDRLKPPFVCIVIERKKGSKDTLDIQGLKEEFLSIEDCREFDKATWDNFAKSNRISDFDADMYFTYNNSWGAIFKQTEYSLNVYIGRCLNGNSDFPLVPEVTSDAEDMVPKLADSARGKVFRIVPKYWVFIKPTAELWINGKRSKIVLKTSPTIADSFRAPKVLSAFFVWAVTLIGGIISLISQQLSPLNQLRDAGITIFFSYLIASFLYWLTNRSNPSWELKN